MLQTQQILADRYQLQTQLSDRPSRQTWLAVDLAVENSAADRQRAIVKLLPLSPQIQWEEIKLFEREAQVLKHLNHPQIPQYRDYFQLDTEQAAGLPGFGLVQDYIPGQTLQQMLDRGVRFTEAGTRSLAVQLLEILIYLHELSPPVLHRDIKPSNIIFQPEASDENLVRGILQGKVFLIDFGSVRDRAVAEGATFTVVGTGGYAPPEQLWGRATPKSDLYALGATLIHLLTGKPPVDLPQKRMRLQFREFAYLTPQFADWLDQLIDPVPERRFSAAHLALEALKSDHLANRNPPISSPVSKAIERSETMTSRIFTWAQYGLVGCAFWLASKAASEMPKSPVVEAYNYIYKMQSFQANYYLKHGAFASSSETSEFGFPNQTDNYQYSIEVTPLAVFYRATPRHQKFSFFDFQKTKGRVGASFATGPKTTGSSIVCHAESPGMSPLPYPIIDNEIFRCAKGTVEPKSIGCGPGRSGVGKDWDIADRTLAYIANGEMGKAIELANTIENQTYQLMTFHALIDKYAVMGNTEQADRWKDRSLATTAKVMKIKSVRVQNILGFSERYAAIGNTELAEQLWMKALETAKPLSKDRRNSGDRWNFQTLPEIAAHANTPERQDKILQIISEASFYSKAHVLEALAPNLNATDPQFDQAIQIAKTLEDKPKQNKVQEEVLEALDRAR
jgi:serine/threonine protein kinase